VAENPDLSWTLLKRFEFIEWRIYWVGRLNRRDLEQAFQISTPQSSVDLRNYQQAAPGNIEYDSTEKAYLPTRDFSPKFLKVRSAERFLGQLQAIKNEAMLESDTWFDTLPPADVPQRVVRAVEAPILRPVLRAIDERASVGIYYQSLTRADMRTVCPHSIAHDGFRWHMRAWCVEAGEFRDYALTRILSIGPIKKCTSYPEDDVEWQTLFTLRLCAHPRLDPDEKAAVERDYRFVEGELEVKLRLALAFYFVRRHNLDLRGGEIEPRRVQLYIKNFDEYETERLAAKQRAKNLAALRAQTTSEEVNAGSGSQAR
jgi:hypothetical protein